MSIKRYILLAGDTYYPSRWRDFVAASDDFEELKERAKAELSDSDYKDWAEIVDLESYAVDACLTKDHDGELTWQDKDYFGEWWLKSG